MCDKSVIILWLDAPQMLRNMCLGHFSASDAHISGNVTLFYAKHERTEASGGPSQKVDFDSW